MTPVEYEFQITRLKNNYGEQNYKLEKSKLLFSIVEEISVKDFERQVSQWILDLKFAPIGEQFREFANKARSSQFSSETNNKNPDETPDCMRCADSGWLLLKMHDHLLQHADAYGYATECSAICDCANGQRVKSGFEASSKDGIKGLAKSAYKPNIHDPWYRIALKWEKQIYGGKSLKEFLNERATQNLLKDIPF